MQHGDLGTGTRRYSKHQGHHEDCQVAEYVRFQRIFPPPSRLEFRKLDNDIGAAPLLLELHEYSE